MKRPWPLAFVALAFTATACGHVESPGANVALGPVRACPENAVDDGFECVAKHTTDPRAHEDDHDDDRLAAKKKPAPDCDPFDDDCDEEASPASA